VSLKILATSEFGKKINFFGGCIFYAAETL